MADYSVDEIIKELDREIQMRHSTYGPLVKRGRMSEKEKLRRIGIIKHIRDGYQASRDRKEAKTQPGLLIPDDPFYPADIADEVIKTAREDAGL